MYVLVGGLYSFWGPAVGVGILLIIPEFFFRDLKGYLPYVTAAILLIIAFTMPNGVVGLVNTVEGESVAPGSRGGGERRCFLKSGAWTSSSAD